MRKFFELLLVVEQVIALQKYSMRRYEETNFTVKGCEICQYSFFVSFESSRAKLMKYHQR